MEDRGTRTAWAWTSNAYLNSWTFGRSVNTTSQTKLSSPQRRLTWLSASEQSRSASRGVIAFVGIADQATHGLRRYARSAQLSPCSSATGVGGDSHPLALEEVQALVPSRAGTSPGRRGSIPAATSNTCGKSAVFADELEVLNRNGDQVQSFAVLAHDLDFLVLAARSTHARSSFPNPSGNVETKTSDVEQRPSGKLTNFSDAIRRSAQLIPYPTSHACSSQPKRSSHQASTGKAKA
jgi:hypothetical protein